MYVTVITSLTKSITISKLSFFLFWGGGGAHLPVDKIEMLIIETHDWNQLC